MKHENNGITWSALLDDYFFARNLRPATECSYKKVVKLFVSYSGVEKTPSMITRQEVLEWRRHLLRDRKQSSQTWNNKIAHLRALYNYGMETDLLPTGNNPFNKCSVQKEKKKKRTLNRSQLIRLYLIMQQAEQYELQNSPSHVTRSAIYPAWFWLTVLDTLRYTGIRQNQLLHVQLRDVNLTENYMDLRLEGSKTHREWRVPIVRQLCMRLTNLLTLAAGAGAKENDRLFDVNLYLPGEKALNQRNDVHAMQQKIRSFFRCLSKKCGFAVSPHRFRHTLATELMKAPERNLQLVKDMLGHRSVSTTMEYVELQMDIAGKALEEELLLHTDLCVEHDIQLIVGNTFK